MREVSFFYPFFRVYLRYHELERDDKDVKENEWNPRIDSGFSRL